VVGVFGITYFAHSSDQQWSSRSTQRLAQCEQRDASPVIQPEFSIRKH
jgi:hypothetical protein